MQVRKVCIHWPSIVAVGIERRPRLTEPQRWFTCVHPSDLPLARLSRMARVGLGHFPLLCSGPLPGRPLGQGQSWTLDWIGIISFITPQCDIVSQFPSPFLGPFLGRTLRNSRRARQAFREQLQPSPNGSSPLSARSSFGR